MRCEKLARRLANVATDVVVRTPVLGRVTLRVVPPFVWRKISGNAVNNCGHVGTLKLGPPIRQTVPGVGNEVSLCRTHKSRDSQSLDEFGLVGRIDKGRYTCCSEGCVFNTARPRRK